MRPYLHAEPPPPPPPDVEPEAALVRPYVLAEERRRDQESADAIRLRLAALMDLAQAEPVPTPAPAPAGDMGELADAVRAYLATTGRPQSSATRHRPKPDRHLVAVNSTSHPCPPAGKPAERRPRTEGAR
ncbi:hypothetical protein [Lipingzhangella halophila]|uniref:hypothetical protein n=1 Tax=Lipingzhangella halophila TaxID=1783352 RepID=UPI00160DBF10|nr:hypothetical protein [Lipingzhangella halophila]